MTRTVLHLIDTGGPGGAETIFTQVSLGVQARGWRSLAAVPYRGWLWETLEASGARPLLVRSSHSFDLRYVGRLVALIRSNGVALVHAHLFDSGVYASLAARVTGLPVVCTLHGRVDVAHSGAFLAAKRRILDRSRNRVVFVSDSLRRWYAERVPMHRAGTTVVYNGIDGSVFTPGRDLSFREELGVAPDELLLGAVGNIRHAKDYSNLLRAAALLRRSGVRARFVIVGEGNNELQRTLEAERHELGLDGAVSFAGFRKDIPRVLRALDLYVSSSSSEGFSLTTVQAMACGLPVLATRCGGPEEIVDDGVTGILVPPSSPEALATGLSRLAGDPALRARLGAAGRGTALRRFTLQTMVGGYEQVYADALGLPMPVRAGAARTPPASPDLEPAR